MKALILNSGIGHRMGDITKTHPKCMTVLKGGQTILQRQLKLLKKAGIDEVIITTGPFEELLINHAKDAACGVKLRFVNNPKYAQTNYIYSVYLARELLKGDLITLHGDLVFDYDTLEKTVLSEKSVMTVEPSAPLPEKDFKAVINEGKIVKVGVEFFNDAVAAQPLYKLKEESLEKWLGEIEKFVARGEIKVYAENALNALDGLADIYPLDVAGGLIKEIDTPEDLDCVNMLLEGENA